MMPQSSDNENTQMTGTSDPDIPAPGPPARDNWQTIAPSKSNVSSTVETFGDYELLQEIARGGMGVVYKARQRGLDRIVALKMILSGQTASDEDIQRFSLEARAAGNLDHPNIVPVYEIGVEGKHHYFTMAFIEGGSLASLIKKQAVVLSFKEAAHTVAMLAGAIQYAHDKGVIHRDLKPENVLIDLQGRPRITDFGLARRLEVDSRLTAAGQIMGTPSFMAPEQATGSHDCGPSVDIYALGGILFYLLTRRPPFLGKTVMETLFQVAKENPQPPSQINPSVPPELDAICLKCLSKDPADRYASAGLLVAALEGWTGQQATVAISATMPLSVGIKPGAGSTSVSATLPATIAPPPSQPARKRLLWPWLAGAAILTCAVWIGAFFVLLPIWKNPGSAIRNPGKDETSPKDGRERTILTEGFTRPEKLRQEFGFKVELNGGSLEPNGEYSVAAETKLSFTIQPDRDAYVGIWAIDADGTVTQIFPNKFQSDNLLRADKVHTIPGQSDPGQPAYKFETTVSKGLDHFWLVASTQHWKELEGERAGPFKVFHSPEQKEQWRRALRGVVVKPVNRSEETDAAVSEEIFAYRARPK
jgi:eukaryotic-like serine/threonine-protein kinase